jgi:hypothetical protein
MFWRNTLAYLAAAFEKKKVFETLSTAAKTRRGSLLTPRLPETGLFGPSTCQRK